MTRLFSCLVPVYDRHQRPHMQIEYESTICSPICDAFLLFYVISPSSCNTKTRSFPCGPFLCERNHLVHEQTDTSHEAKPETKLSVAQVHTMHLSTTPFRERIAKRFINDGQLGILEDQCLAATITMYWSSCLLDGEPGQPVELLYEVNNGKIW